MTTTAAHNLAAAIFRRLKGIFAKVDELYQPISGFTEIDLSAVDYPDYSSFAVGSILRNCPNITYDGDAISGRYDAIFLGIFDDASFSSKIWLAIPNGDDIFDGNFQNYGIYYAFAEDAGPMFSIDHDRGQFAQEDIEARFNEALAGKVTRYGHRHPAEDITSGTIAIDRLPVGTDNDSVARGNHTHSNYAASSHTHSNYALANHTHAIAAVSGLTAALDNKQGVINQVWNDNNQTSTITFQAGNNQHISIRVPYLPSDAGVLCDWADRIHTHTVATTTAAGMMSAADKQKLDKMADLSVWTGTQAEYDALTNIDQSTLYIITEG